MEGYIEQIVSNSSNLIVFFQTTIYLLKNMDAYMTALVYKL